MPLTDAQKQLIINIDRHATEIIFKGGGNDHDLFQYVNSLGNDGQLKEILKTNQEEISTLYERYDGFRLIIELLKQLAICASKGIIPKSSEELLSHWRKNGLEKVKSHGDAITDELTQVMTTALFQMQKIIAKDLVKKQDFLSVVKLFLSSIMSTAGDLVELAVPGSAQIMYADLEAVAKAGGFRAIRKQQLGQSTVNYSYSVSNIDSNDKAAAMNYLGQELSTTLFKAIHELPMSLRSPEMFLRGIEALLANLLDQKFNNAHRVLDDLCAHVHMALDDLKARKN